MAGGGAAPMAAPGAIAAPELPDFSQWGPIERVPFSTLQRKTAAVLQTAWSNAPHVTQFDEADITDLEAFRKRFRETPDGKKAKLTVTAFILKAITVALKRFPQFNASLDARTNELIYKRYYHIGVAVDTEAGLIVPIIRNVDQKTVLDIAAEMNELAERTRQRKVGLDELKGGTFTVTNLGGIGGTAFTPIVNYPEVAILGLARSREQPRLVGGQWTSRLVLPLCLSYDHRVINGADGARFLRRLVELLEDSEMMLVEA
jgi:pyruvate dehydrogenase E2 component (dihydrolipoamide acetyltransferase)